MTSSACVPIEPVEPSTTTARGVADGSESEITAPIVAERLVDARMAVPSRIAGTGVIYTWQSRTPTTAAIPPTPTPITSVRRTGDGTTNSRRGDRSQAG